MQIQRTISDFVCIIKESLYKCNLLSFSFTIYLTDICEHLGNFFGTVCKAANKTINRGSSQRFLKWANEQTNEHGTQVMSKTAKVIRIRGEGREGVEDGVEEERYGKEGNWKEHVSLQS